MLQYPFVFIHLISTVVNVELFSKFEFAAFVSLHHSNISEEQLLTFSPHLLVLDLHNNTFETIPENYFSSGGSIQNLVLSWNNINMLLANSFEHLVELRVIVLDNNPITNLHCGLWLQTKKLVFLSVSNITFLSIGVDFFASVKPKVIISSDFQICCVKPLESACSAKTPWFRSCADLAEDHHILTGFIVMFVLVLLVNIFSIAVHFFDKNKNNKAYTALIIAMNLTKMSVAVFLGIFWIAGLTFKGSFHVNQNKWRSGATCFAAFGCFLFYVVVDQLETTLLSLTRLMVVMKPIDTHFKHMSYISKLQLTSIFAVAVVSLAGSLILKLVHGDVPTKFCVFLFNPTGYMFLQVLTWIAVICQFISLIAVACMHAATHNKTVASNLIAVQSVQKDTKSLVAQLTMITMALVCCWLPVNGIGIACMFLKSYPVELMAWTLAAIVPLNSILIPSILVAFILRKYHKSKAEKKRKEIGVKQNEIPLKPDL